MELEYLPAIANEFMATVGIVSRYMDHLSIGSHIRKLFGLHFECL